MQQKQLHVVESWLDLGASPNLADNNGCCALHYAVLAPFDAAVVLLLVRGANVNVRLPNGSTPLLLATIKAHTRLVTRLCRFKGTDVNLADREGHTPLMVAARSGHAEMVKDLLEHGAAFDAVDKDGHTALWYAVKYENKGCAMVLRQWREETAEKTKGASKKAARAKVDPSTKDTKENKKK